MDSPYNIGDVDTYLARAELMFDLDRCDEARDEIGGALSLDPAHVPSLTLLAILELQVGNYDDALTAASSALAAEPTHDTALLARGHALALLHRTEEALQTADDLTERHPDSWWHHIHYALIVRETRNGQEALDAAWVAVHLAPEDARAHLTLAVVASNLGLDDLSERALAAAGRFDPDAGGYMEGELGPRLLRGNPKPSTPHVTTEEEPQKPKAIDDRDRTQLPAEIRKILLIAGGSGVIIPLLAGWLGGENTQTAQLIAGIGALIAIAVLVIFIRKLPGESSTTIRDGIDTDRVLGLTIIAAALGPAMAAIFATTGFVFALPIATISGIATVLLAHRRYAL